MPFEAIALDQVMASLEGAKKLKLVLLDARRDNPFAPLVRPRAFAVLMLMTNSNLVGCCTGIFSRWTQRQRSGARQAQRIESDEMPLTMVEQVRWGGAASSTDSSRGSKVFSSARISRRARWAPTQ